MPPQYKHLTLPVINEDFTRKKRTDVKIVYGWPKGLAPRDKNEYYTTEIQSFEHLKQAYNEQKDRYRKYFDPKLIFKLNINQSVSEENFIKNLEGLNLEVISPSPDKKGYWIVFTEDKEFGIFKKKLKEYVENERYPFFNAIEGIYEIPSEEKKGESLLKLPFQNDENSFIDVEIWRMPDGLIKEFLNGFNQLVNDNNGKITDVMITPNFCLVKLKSNKQLLDEILSLREVARVDRPPKMKIDTKLSQDISDINIKGEPTKDSTGILILDSGILSGHPLLKGAIGYETVAPTRYSDHITEDMVADDVGHGTQVSGIALYGDIEECIDNNVFNRELWIFSVKLMYSDQDGYSTYDEEELVEHQLETAVRKIVGMYPQCKVVNISFGDSTKRMYVQRRQFNLASLIDELAKELKIIFVICAGNLDLFYDQIDINDYPSYLLDESSDKVKIIDPATSALGLTVGALYKNELHGGLIQHYPSMITRTGPGLKGMIKPEIVDVGGSGIDNNCSVITINDNWIQEGRLFTLVDGTSYCAPKVAHYLAKIYNEYPSMSPNLIKALLLSSASIPEDKPGQLSSSFIEDGGINAFNLFKIYGYGKPNLEKAIYSTNNRVLLLRERSIKPDNIDIYPFYLSKEFVDTKGPRTITATLVFDPPINKNSSDYLGVTFEMRLFKNIDPEIIARVFSKKEIITNDDGDLPDELKPFEISMYPGTTIRKKGVHQKATRTFIKSPSIDTSKPLVLMVLCRNRWVKEEKYMQDYSVVVSIEHSQGIDIYNTIRARNEGRVDLHLRR